MSGAEAPRLEARAPAKLNLSLHVGPRRADGLHRLCSLFQSVSLADELRLEPAGDADEIVCPAVEGPNLAAAAIAGYRERFDWDGPPVRLTIEKRIPVAAGLGGGSADAAAALRLAAAAAGASPGRPELTELAMSLGADVPSQLEPGLQLVTGAGEQVEPLGAPPALAFVLLTSEAALSTRAVYERADELGLPPLDERRAGAELRAAVEAGRPGAIAAILHNDLEPAALALEPTAGRALELLRVSGALGAIVSGSGPAAFGLYESAAAAERARSELASGWPGSATVVSPVGPEFGAPRPAGARRASA